MEKSRVLVPVSAPVFRDMAGREELLPSFPQDGQEEKEDEEDMGGAGVLQGRYDGGEVLLAGGNRLLGNDGDLVVGRLLLETGVTILTVVVLLVDDARLDGLGACACSY